LAELGEPMLSNEEELRQLYGAYLAQMRPLIVERVRRHHFEDFQEGRDLQAYVDRTRLTFLPFNTDWVLTRETLDLATVEEHVFRLLDETLGPDMPVDLAAFSRVLEANRRSVRRFAQGAAPVIRAWCRKHDVPTPEPWREDDPQVIVRHLENQGLLDFEPMEHEQIPVICRRAGCWPANMPPSLDRSHLAIGEREVDEENERRERERRQNEIAQRSIEFAGRSLDTGDADFADAFRETAEEWLAADESWFDRSRRRIRLTELHSPERGLGGGHGGKGNSAQRRERRLTEAQRSAMGLAGEWLAYRFLKRRDPDYVDEACWISENRARFFGGGEGDDGMGFDFRVRTPQAEWLYEVKSSLEDSGEFELTANELRVASSAAKDRSRRYRILYVPFVFSPDKWYVAELPNPMGEKTRHRFEPMGRGSVRFRFERR